MLSQLELISEHRCFDGWQRYYQHPSQTIGLPMRFSVYLPPQAGADAAKNAESDANVMGSAKLPVLFFLAGLTCTEETFMTKAAAQQYAAEHGIILVTPDTSPRGAGFPGEDDGWDFGTGAGFYVDATQSPWSQHYRMESYVVSELYDIATTLLPGDAERVGIFGHSMGGHGALVLAQRYPGKFKSVSAFAPISAPTQCPWGEKAFSGYLGNDKSTWEAYDASLLMQKQSSAPYPEGILVDQGLADQFLAEQLYPEALEEACQKVGQPLTLRRHEGYDHSYYFILSFIADHMKFHAERL
ncbi:S-formylglutathione hydrolase [Paenalcaligenes niemegkensis]|uniref:S-formylglutathione hydrolase n=1 Tax=Paenalcaligenes niemegkensis TaxID=2895469 RepID=UPI0027E2C620|nr:S-formylglutathione hydrolase [Paenalcaligenes niemegkensis]